MTIGWMAVAVALGGAMAGGQVLAVRRSLWMLVSTVVAGMLAAVALVAYLGDWTAAGTILLGYWLVGAVATAKHWTPRRQD